MRGFVKGKNERQRDRAAEGVEKGPSPTVVGTYPLLYEGGSRNATYQISKQPPRVSLCGLRETPGQLAIWIENLF
jgi:hypothetical protein